MEDQELERALRETESDRVERKQAVSDRDKIRQAICAFANDLPNHRQPGIIFIGVTDDGACAQLPITDELLRTLADMRSDGNILPFPSMTVQKRVLAGCEMAVILVAPADAPPVRYNGRVWIRVGPRRATATPEEERRLTEKRRARDLPWDLWPVSMATLADLDLDLFQRVYLPSALAPDVIEQNQRTLEQQLASLRFTTPAPNATPTVLGLLVTGRDARQFLPGAYVQFLRIDGEELTDPVRDQAEISGPLTEMMLALESRIQAHISVASDFTSQPLEIRRPEYPIVALQQVARNAILHRAYQDTNAPVRITWFNDRIEIQNPGGPYGQVTPETFGTPGLTDYRNPHLANAMKDLGYVQRFGAGIPLMRRELEKNGNPPPEFEVNASQTLVRLRKKHP
ncbi:MAG: ATP-binding protein [Blastocatellia bacterium]